MFGELPKLLGKTFLIGYMLPAALALLAEAALSDAYLRTSIYRWALATLGSADEKQLAFRLGLAVAIAWVAGVVLLSINHTLIRLLEGYGLLNPARLLKWWSVSVFDGLTAEHDAIEAQRVDGRIPPQLAPAHSRVRLRLGNEFPEEGRLLLPTRFGNVIRAFERYPQVIYKIDAIHTWPRLQAFVPEAYAGLLDDAKAQLDFWVNVWFGLCVLAISAAALFICSGNCSLGFVFAAAVILAMAAAKGGQMAAAQWGELVKGAFDLYRGDLCKQLGLEMPRSIESERAMWTSVSQTFIFRRAEYADGLTHFRPLKGEEK
jgi:hypothetical protein